MQENKSVVENAVPAGPDSLSHELRSIVTDSAQKVAEAHSEPPKKRGGARPGAGRKAKVTSGAFQNDTVHFSSGSDLGGGHDIGGGDPAGAIPHPTGSEIPRSKVHIGSKSFQTIFRAFHKIAAVRTGYQGFCLEPELAEDMGNSAEAVGRDWMPALAPKWVSLIVFTLVTGCVVLMKVIDWVEWAEARRTGAAPAAGAQAASSAAEPSSSAAAPMALPYRPIMPVRKPQ